MWIKKTTHDWFILFILVWFWVGATRTHTRSWNTKIGRSDERWEKRVRLRVILYIIKHTQTGEKMCVCVWDSEATSQYVEGKIWKKKNENFSNKKKNSRHAFNWMDKYQMRQSWIILSSYSHIQSALYLYMFLSISLSLTSHD